MPSSLTFQGFLAFSLLFGGMATRFQPLRLLSASRSIQPVGSVSRALLKVTLPAPASRIPTRTRIITTGIKHIQRMAFPPINPLAFSGRSCRTEFVLSYDHRGFSVEGQRKKWGN